MLKFLKSLVLMLLTTTSLLAAAGATDPLFVSLTSDDAHRATMAIEFGSHHAKQGHPLSIFLNDRGVFVGVKSGAAKFASQQKALADIIASGGTVIMCPSCLKHFGFTEADLLPGIKLGNAEITGSALFKDGTKALSW